METEPPQDDLEPEHDDAEPADDDDMVDREELRHVIGQRQKLKAKLHDREATIEALQEQVATMTAERSAPPPEAEPEPKAEPPPEAGEARLQALQSQLTGMQRDQAIQNAAARLGAVDPGEVLCLLRSRVRMVEQGGQFVPEYLDADGKPMLTSAGVPVTDPDSFVSGYLAGKPHLCKSTTTPGSGAKPAGGQPSGEPGTLAQLNAMEPDQRAAVVRKMSIEQIRALTVPPAGKPLGVL